MKKNVMMRVASALLVAVLMTTCAISGTFAKYTSTATTSDQARVAKWGWGATAVSIDLFDDVYGTTVDSADGKNVIAPGTGKTSKITWTPAATFTPEVDYTISFKVTATIPAEIEAELNWTLKIDDEAVQNFDTFTDLAAVLNAKTYAGEASTEAPTFNIVIGWDWPIGTTPEDNAADTALGNAGSLAQLTVNVELIATQVD